MSGSALPDIGWAALSLVVIVAACELFTNGIEWFGRKLSLSEGAVGSVLAAFGTALPETLVSVVAILWVGGEAGRRVGIGGILGAPFMLSTLALFVTGLSVLLFARRRAAGHALSLDAACLRWDVAAFLGAYATAVAAAYVPYHWVKGVVAGLLVVSYAAYVRRQFSRCGEERELEQLKALYFHRNAEGDPRMHWTVLQTVVALVGIFAGARFFVRNLTGFCDQLGTDPRLFALIIVPVATELPETFNSVLWVRQGKDGLALGNITGAMVFQSCIPVSVGLLFTDWQLGFAGLASALIALGSGVVLFLSLTLLRRLSPAVLLGGALGYGLFLALTLR